MFTDDDLGRDLAAVHDADGLVHIAPLELLDELSALGRRGPPGDDPEWPFLLSAGERRSFTANTILRDPAWRKRDAEARCAVATVDAARLGIDDGDLATLTTEGQHGRRHRRRRDARRSPRHPNGLGLDHVEGDERVLTGVAPNELTASGDRDRWAGTPWHKTVPARLVPATA